MLVAQSVIRWLFVSLRNPSLYPSVASLYTNPPNTVVAGLRQLCVMRAQSTLGPFERARQTSGFNPIKKPLLSHRSAAKGKQNRSNGELGINSYLIAGAHVFLVKFG